jgi:hypothetical protein
MNILTLTITTCAFWFFAFWLITNMTKGMLL